MTFREFVKCLKVTTGVVEGGVALINTSAAPYQSTMSNCEESLSEAERHRKKLPASIRACWEPCDHNMGYVSMGLAVSVPTNNAIGPLPTMFLY